MTSTTTTITHPDGTTVTCTTSAGAASPPGKLKLYTCRGIPNPDKITFYATMAGCIDKLEEIPVDVFGGENRTPEFLAKNPAGTVPALVLADGSIMGETLAICEYLDEVFGPSDVVGKTPEARLETRMWLGRVDEMCRLPLHMAFQNGPMHDFFAPRFGEDKMLPEAAPKLLKSGHAGFKWLDTQLEAGKGPFFCGERCTLADIELYCYYKFFNKMAAEAGFVADPENKNIAAWLDACAATEGGKLVLLPAP